MSDFVQIIMVKGANDDGTGGTKIVSPAVKMIDGQIDNIADAFWNAYPNGRTEPNPNYVEGGEEPKELEVPKLSHFVRKVKEFVMEVAKPYIIQKMKDEDTKLQAERLRVAAEVAAKTVVTTVEVDLS